MPGDHGFTENDQGQVVEAFVDQFDWSHIDSMEDTLRQALKDGKGIGELIEGLIEEEVRERVNEAIAAVLCIISESKRPRLTIDHIAYATGMAMNQGASITTLARKHRQRKQAFSQGALRLAEKLGLRPSRQMRSLKAREAMARAYRLKHG